MSVPSVVSKFRNVFGTAAKPDKQFRDVKVSSTISDLTNFIAANAQYYAVAWASGGGGKLVVQNLADKGRVSDSCAFTGHKGPILDWEFHPFASNLIATASEDCTVKLWKIPDGGLTADVDDAEITLAGHGKKVGICHFSHVANHVLTTASYDHTIRLWDIEKGEKNCIDVHKDLIMSFDYNLDGSAMVTSSRDKIIRIIDPRSNAVTTQVPGHAGSKPSKVVWAKRRNQIFSVGFTKMQERQLTLWDPRMMEKKLFEKDLDNQSGTMMTFFDEDTNMLYLGGKGDGNIRYFELWDQNPPVVDLASFSSGVPQRGLTMLPKVACDTTVCEVAHFLKLESDKIVPISFQNPRKTAAMELQTDVYVDTFSNSPTVSADEFFAGEFKAPNTMPIQHTTGGSSQKAPAPEFVPANANPQNVRAAYEAQQLKVEKLKEQLAHEEKVLQDLESSL